MVYRRNGNILPVHLGILNDAVLGHGIGQASLEHLLHFSGVSSGPAQEGGGLKGAASGAHGEVLGVQHQARHHGLCLAPQQFPGLHEVAQQLADQLTGGRGVGLVEVEGAALDVGGGPAVVVDDRHLVAGLEHLSAGHLLGAVGVHHHQQGPGVCLQEGLLAVQKQVLVLLHPLQLAVQLVGGGGSALPDDVVGHTLLAGNGAHAHGGAHGIHVGGGVAHDEHAGGVRHQLAQGGGHDPALDLGALLGLLGPATEELEVEAVFHHRLIATPGQGHLHGQRGKAVQVRRGLPVHAQPQR